MTDIKDIPEGVEVETPIAERREGFYWGVTFDSHGYRVELTGLCADDVNAIIDLINRNRELEALLQDAPYWIKEGDENLYSDGNDETAFDWCVRVKKALQENQ